MGNTINTVLSSNCLNVVKIDIEFSNIPTVGSGQQRLLEIFTHFSTRWTPISVEIY